MKFRQTITITALCAIGAGLVACGKQESTPTPPAAPAMEKPAASAPAVPAAPATPAAPAAPANGAQSLLDKAQKLIASKDYSGAMTTLKDLSKLKLTPEQQSLLDQLKATVQKAMAADATSDATKKATDALGGALGGK
ncbi:MAG: hypothetical protein PCFJNLEI_01062 [Verrucomicrobiae bacterium]|nr:hypothetical protein [Verrucomicrobiae bacterium]